MCQLEMCFPPSFFDMMEHYMIHLADQVFVLGPMYVHASYVHVQASNGSHENLCM
jgi:hypothetical protein